MTTSRQEAQWVLRAQCADRDALETLLRAVQPSLRGYVARLVGVQDADDVVQEVFIIICRKVAWLQDPALFRPWMYRIATRAAFRYLKKARRYVEEPLDALDSMAALEGQPSDEDLRRLLGSDALSLATRAVLVLHFREELTLVEIAAVLEIPLGTVKSPAAIKVLYAASGLQMIVIAACTAVIQVSMTRMTRIILRAIELTSDRSR